MLVRNNVKNADHITVIEGFMQLNTERNTIESEIKELKSNILTYIEQLNKEQSIILICAEKVRRGDKASFVLDGKRF